MKQALHIFKKDVRYLRYEIGIALLAALAFCFAGVRQGLPMPGVAPNQGTGFGVLAILLPVTWWFLITRVVHAESLVGDRQFWLTRPYEWKSLLGAKILFIVVFVNFPLFVADAVIVPSFGLSLSHEMAGLLWTQVLLTAAFTLPAAALSCVVSGIAPLIAVLLLIISSALASMLFAPWMRRSSFWMELDWMKTYYLLAVAFVAAITIMLWQYARRKTAVTRIIVGGAGVIALAGVSLFPWTTAFALQMRLSPQKVDPSGIQIGLDLDRKWLGQRRPIPVDGVGVCSSSVNFLRCNSAFRTGPDFVSIRVLESYRGGAAARTQHPRRFVSYSPFPADLNINPIHQLFAPQFSPIFEVVIETLEPLAYLRRDFEINDVRLKEFETHPHAITDVAH